MKTIVIIIDLIICVLVVYGAIVNFSNEYLLDSISLFLIPILIVLNIICIRSKSGIGWLDLYLKRKTLEEKKKIDELLSK